MYVTVLYIEASQSHWVEVGYRGAIADRGAEIVRRLHALANALNYNISALVLAGVEGGRIPVQQQNLQVYQAVGIKKYVDAMINGWRV